MLPQDSAAAPQARHTGTRGVVGGRDEPRRDGPEYDARGTALVASRPLRPVTRRLPPATPRSRAADLSRPPASLSRRGPARQSNERDHEPVETRPKGMSKRLLAIGALAALLLGGSHGRAQPRDLGYLDVSSEPRAEILIDGKPTGLWTPQTIPLRAGHHKLTLVRPERDRRASHYGFIVEARQTTRLAIHLAA
jgi:hypothetical protein